MPPYDGVMLGPVVVARPLYDVSVNVFELGFVVAIPLVLVVVTPGQIVAIVAVDAVKLANTVVPEPVRPIA